MTYSTEHIAKQLKAARENNGLSQRELSVKSGVPQSHISKIENGNVDLRLSSLVGIARALGMEWALIPRQAMPAINAILKQKQSEAIDDAPPRPAYSLEDDED
jgi:hypothetical protein